MTPDELTAFLRVQSDTRLHAAADLIEEQAKEIDALEAELYEQHLVEFDAFHAGFGAGQLAQIRDERLRRREQ